MVLHQALFWSFHVSLITVALWVDGKQWMATSGLLSTISPGKDHNLSAWLSWRDCKLIPCAAPWSMSLASNKRVPGSIPGWIKASLCAVSFLKGYQLPSGAPATAASGEHFFFKATWPAVRSWYNTSFCISFLSFFFVFPRQLTESRLHHKCWIFTGRKG